MNKSVFALVAFAAFACPSAGASAVSISELGIQAGALISSQVEMPVFIPDREIIAVGTPISIMCDTPGAEIRYTLDGSVPDENSSIYESPIPATDDILIQAVAYKEGMAPSETAYSFFHVVMGDPALMSMFDFANPETLDPSVPEPAVKDYVPLDGRSFTNGDVRISFRASETGNTHVRLFGSYDAGCDLRIYDGEQMTVCSTDPACCLESVVFEISRSGTSDVDLLADCGEYIWEENTWYAGEDIVGSVTFTSVLQSRIRRMMVVMGKSTGLMEYDPESADNVPVYYDLSGMRLSGCPEKKGFYIERCGSKARKIRL